MSARLFTSLLMALAVAPACAATLSVVGAAIGVGGGIALAKVVQATTPLPAAVAVWSIFAALALGAAGGIGAGVYPASRAARLDPIAALRQE